MFAATTRSLSVASALSLPDWLAWMMIWGMWGSVRGCAGVVGERPGGNRTRVRGFADRCLTTRQTRARSGNVARDGRYRAVPGLAPLPGPSLATAGSVVPGVDVGPVAVDAGRELRVVGQPSGAVELR